MIAKLDAAVAREGLHHAYLFEGPSGLGKRLVADWLTRRVNCTGDAPPCGRCGQCVRIAAGTHPDVIALVPDPGKASQTIGVDAVREVIRQAGYRRYDSKRRFIVVDPADAMLEPAANALLKTLEEPPPGTGFVLIATSSRHLLPTIVSRCQRVRFGAVPAARIATWLADRGLGADPTARELASRLALGCPGRAVALLDGGLDARRELRSGLVRAVTGSLAASVEHADALTRKRTKQEWSGDVEAMLEVIEDLLRDVAVHASGADLPLLNADEPGLVAAWAARLWPGGVERVARQLRATREQLEINVSGRLALDALLARLRAELSG